MKVFYFDFNHDSTAFHLQNSQVLNVNKKRFSTVTFFLHELNDQKLLQNEWLGHRRRQGYFTGARAPV